MTQVSEKAEKHPMLGTSWFKGRASPRAGVQVSNFLFFYAIYNSLYARDYRTRLSLKGDAI